MIRLVKYAVSMLWFAVLCAWATTAGAQDETSAAATDEFFESHVRPLLVNRCIDCHSGDEPEGELQLDSLAGMLTGGSRGPAIVPGDTAGSLLVLAINHAGQLDMPPRQKLPQDEIAILTQWVEAGANWPGEQPTRPAASTETEVTITDEDRSFWSFQAVREPAVPEVASIDWCRSPIDHFILNRLEQAELTPVSAADKRTLIRRATLDLIGLPPTPDEIADFLADDSPDNFAKVVDRLLASPRYGERWGRYWLDVARYADSNGLDENLAFANAWRYRDYVIQAFNEDRPYDVFLQEQIAGDLLLPTDDAAATLHRIIATGFLSLGAKMLAEDDPVKMEMDIIDEQVDTLGRAVMGLTLGCARCHDHKFDPILMNDYYGLAGIFKSTTTMENFSVVARWQEVPVATLTEIEQHRRLVDQQDELQARIDELLGQYEEQVLSLARRQFNAYLLEAFRLALFNTLAESRPISDERLTAANTPGLIVREAEDFDRGNVNRDFETYGNEIGVLVNIGDTPNFTEYEIDVAESGVYRFDIRYAAADSRPCQLFVDGKMRAIVAGDETGTWNPDSQTWFMETLIALDAGPHVLRLEQPDFFPHIDQFALTALPADSSWNLEHLQFPTATDEVDLHAEIVDNLRVDFRDAKDDPGALLHPWWQFFESGGEVASAETDSTQLNQLLAGEPPTSWNELAQRYQSLADLLLDEESASGEAGDLQPFQRVLFDEEGPFQLDDVPLDDAAESQLAEWEEQVEKLEESLNMTSMAMAVSDGEIEDLRIHLRGSHVTLGDVVPRRMPVVFTSSEQFDLTNESSGRLELAAWLTDPEHPLTARVMVNRIWQMHFGHGLVRTPDNFGRLGELPSHPELLDWLAARFVESGWSIKAMHRQILLSATWQQSTEWNARGAEVDPENILLWRMNRQRLDAESLRDSLLAVGGELDLTMGGSLLPTENRAYVTNTSSINVEVYDNPRRTIYLPIVRSSVFDYLNAFDFGDPSVMRGQRDRTTIAPQALYLMNSNLAAEQAESLAGSLLMVDDHAARVCQLFETLFARLPDDAETSACLEFVARYSEQQEPTTGSDTDPAAAGELAAWKALCRSLMASNEFYFID